MTTVQQSVTITLVTMAMPIGILLMRSRRKDTEIRVRDMWCPVGMILLLGFAVWVPIHAVLVLGPNVYDSFTAIIR